MSERAVKAKVALPFPSILSMPSEVIALEIFAREETFKGTVFENILGEDIFGHISGHHFVSVLPKKLLYGITL